MNCLSVQWNNVAESSLRRKKNSNILLFDFLTFENLKIEKMAVDYLRIWQYAKNIWLKNFGQRFFSDSRRRLIYLSAKCYMCPFRTSFSVDFRGIPLRVGSILTLHLKTFEQLFWTTTWRKNSRKAQWQTQSRHLCHCAFLVSFRYAGSEKTWPNQFSSISLALVTLPALLRR